MVEAAAAGLPLVLSDIPVFRELWDGAARFFAPRDAAALADAVNRLAEDPASRAALAGAARRRAARYGVEAQARAVAGLYDGLLDDGLLDHRPLDRAPSGERRLLAAG